MRSLVPFRSLSAKLILLFLAMALVLALLTAGGIRSAFRAHFKENIRPHLFHYMEYIRHDIGTPPDPRKAGLLAKKLPLEIFIKGPDIDWSSDGSKLAVDTLEPHRSFSREGVDYTLGEQNGREYLISREGEYILAFSVRHIHDRSGWSGIIGIGALLLLLMILYYAIRRLFSPISAIRDGVKRFGSGDLTHRIQIKRKDELGELSRSINTMADDIQQMLDAKRQLLLAISHELRSPLTRAKVSIGMLDDADTRHEINHDLDEMEKLIEELLETERLSNRHHTLHREQVSLSELVRDLIDDQFVNRRIRLQLPDEPVIASIDASRLRLLLKNLLQNALQYTPEDADPPQLRLEPDGDRVVIRVRDFGTGISEQHLPYLTEPFYRVDPARQRETGGYGLGLYLCRMIAEAHGGTLTIDSTPGEGTGVLIEIPLRQGN